ncbi:MAG: hypothetical protein FJ290_12500 [Planctomycetes bacterium]|nr:hypothetical protein [Planctomycetota bacterium]
MFAPKSSVCVSARYFFSLSSGSRSLRCSICGSRNFSSGVGPAGGPSTLSGSGGGRRKETGPDQSAFEARATLSVFSSPALPGSGTAVSSFPLVSRTRSSSVSPGFERPRSSSNAFFPIGLPLTARMMSPRLRKGEEKVFPFNGPGITHPTSIPPVSAWSRQRSPA